MSDCGQPIQMTWERRFLGRGWACYEGPVPNGPAHLLVEPDMYAPELWLACRREQERRAE
jgi:hypothetical protein